MDFKELKYIIAIHKCGSISNAADALGISQPSLSKFLQNVEKKYRVTLFNRKGKQLVLTYAGEKYVNIAGRILQLADNIEDNQFGDQDTEINKLTIIFPPEKEEYLFPNVFSQFRKNYPDTTLVIKTGTGNIERLLLSGEVDIAITDQKINNRRIYQEKIWDEEIVLVTTTRYVRAGKGVFHPNFSEPFIDLKKIDNNAVILVSSNERIKTRVEALMEREGIKPHIFMVTNNNSTSLKTVASGMGVCLVPQLNTHYYRNIDSLVFFSLGDPELRMETYFTCRKSFSTFNSASYFQKLIGQHVDMLKKQEIVYKPLRKLKNEP